MFSVVRVEGFAVFEALFNRQETFVVEIAKIVYILQ